MHIYSRLSSLLTAAFIATTAATAAPAGYDLTAHTYKASNPSRAFSNARAKQIQSIDATMQTPQRREAAATDRQPNVTYGPTSTYGDLDGPNGQLWFYTLDMENEVIVHDTATEQYTEYILQSYKISIYDHEHRLVGTVSDKMHYEDGEVRVPYCDILPIVTQHFFNDDDKYEIILGLAINWKPGINHYRSLVYQIDGEKDADGNDKIIATIPNMISDVLNASTATEECYYFTLMGEHITEYTRDMDNTPAFWQRLLDNYISLDIYSKPEAGSTELKKVYSYTLPYMMIPGDQENVSVGLTFMRNGEPYLFVHHYEDTLFNPYYSYDEDYSQRDNNNLVCEIYKLSQNGAELVQQTKIPAPLIKGEDYVIGTFYSVGNLQYTRDIDYDYTADGKAAFVVDVDKYYTTSESYVTSFYVHNAAGDRIHTVFENCQSMLHMSDVAGFERQIMFVNTKGSEYYFNFVDMKSCKLAASFSYIIETDEDSDPDRMTANIDRVAYGDSYAYVDELRMPIEDEGNSYLRIMWLDKRGNYIRTDEVNMGQDVQYAMSYLDGGVLKADAYHSDDAMEYMLLIKRSTNTGKISEELLVGQARSKQYPEGRDLLLVTPDAHKGVLSTVMSYHHADKPSIVVVFYNSAKRAYTADFYHIPFDKNENGIFTPGAGIAQDGVIAFDGTTLYAEGAIEVYNLQGIRLAAAGDKLDVTALPAGIYVARTATASAKFVKK